MDQVSNETGVARRADQTPRRDHYVHYTHEMSDDTAEASARFLIRGVPVVYGALLGGLVGNLFFGVALGAALMIGLDMRMGTQSMFKPLLGRLFGAFGGKR